MNRMLSCLMLMILAVTAQGFSSPKFHHLTINDGLLPGNATCFLKDADGFVWIGTDEGLCRYDGREIKVYGNGVDASLSGKTVRSLFQDSKGNLWVGFKEDGICCHLVSEGIWKSFSNVKDVPESLSSNDVAGIVEDSKGGLWIAADRGSLDRIDRDFQTFRHYSISSGKGADFINAFTDIAIDWHDRIWLSTWGAGVYCYDIKKNDFYHLNDSGSVKDDGCQHIFDIHIHGTDLYVASAYDGLFLYDISSVELQPLLKSKPECLPSCCKQVSVDKEGDVWVTTPDEVLVMRAGALEYRCRSSLAKSEGEIMSDVASCIYTDRDGTVWVGHQSGVSFSHPQFNQFTNLVVKSGDTLTPKMLSAIATADHSIWVGGINHIYRCTRDGRQKEVFSPDCMAGKRGGNHYFQALHDDGKGNIWAGVYGKYLMRLRPYDRNWNKIDISCPDTLHIPYGNIRDIFEDTDGTLWLATETGVLNYSPSDGRIKPLFRSRKNIYPQDKARKIFRDSRGELYVGTEGGLRRYDSQGTLVDIYGKETANGTLTNDYITSIMEDSSGRLWVGGKGGLYEFDRDSSCFIPLASFNDSSFSDSVFSIVEDNEGNLWIGASAEILRYDSRTGVCYEYNERDGLCNSGNFKIAYKSDDGLILTGGEDGINLFYPDRLIRDTTSNKVVITESVISGNSVSLSFVAPNTIMMEKLRYRYMLEGYDRQWTEVNTTCGRAEYEDLPSGIYVFRVKATDNNKEWREDSAEVRIVVRPPANRWWIIGTCLAILVTFATIWYTRRMSVRRREEAVSSKEEPVRKNDFMDRMNDIILKNIDKSDLDLGFLAAEMNMSEDQLTRKVKSLTDTTPWNIVIRLRMQRAAALIVQGEMNISQVAYSVGFNDLSHFSRTFKKHFGVAPRDYSRENDK